MAPHMTMLVGLPAAGKSTYCHEADAVILSTDDLVERRATEMGQTYNEVWPIYINAAETVMWEMFRDAVKARRDIIVDRTNLTVKSRRKFLSQLPKDYLRRAVVVMCPEDVRAARASARVGKIIPVESIERMKASFVLPTLEEGFDKITYLSTYEKEHAA